MVFQFSQRHGGDARKGSAIDVVVDAHHGIDTAFVVRQGTIIEMLQGQVGKKAACRFSHHVISRGQPGVSISGLAEVRSAKQLLQALKVNSPAKEVADVNFIRLGLRDRNGRKWSQRSQAWPSLT